MLHIEIDKWRYDIEESGNMSTRTRRLYQVLSRLHEKYYNIYDKNTLVIRGECRCPKHCMDRIRPRR